MNIHLFFRQEVTALDYFVDLSVILNEVTILLEVKLPHVCLSVDWLVGLSVG